MQLSLEKMSDSLLSSQNEMREKLSKVDDSDVIKKWTNDILNADNKRMNLKMDEIKDAIKKRIDQLEIDNLFIDGLTRGKTATHPNLKNYLKHLDLKVKQGFADFSVMIDKMGQVVKESTEITESQCKNLIEFRVGEQNDKVQEFSRMVRTIQQDIVNRAVPELKEKVSEFDQILGRMKAELKVKLELARGQQETTVQKILDFTVQVKQLSNEVDQNKIYNDNEDIRL
jgi:hypothetical protein